MKPSQCKMRGPTGTCAQLEWTQMVAGHVRSGFRSKTRCRVKRSYVARKRIVRAQRIALFGRRSRRSRRKEFFEARVTAKWIEHRIEPEQRRSERDIFSEWAWIRYRE